MTQSPRHKMPWTPEEDRQIETLRQEGLSLREIAESIGRPHSSTVSRASKIGARKKKPEEVRRATQPHVCLGCGSTFDSVGPQNRLCGSCRARGE